MWVQLSLGGGVGIGNQSQKVTVVIDTILILILHSIGSWLCCASQAMWYLSICRKT